MTKKSVSQKLKVCKVENCDSSYEMRRDWCNNHYRRWLRHGNPLGGDFLHDMTPKQRFWLRVNKTNSCWLWTGHEHIQGIGYGTILVDGKKILAHRYSWVLHNGDIPKGSGYHGTCVLHKCDNPSCVNPEHLFLGTQQDNILDQSAKGRQAKGERHGHAKFTKNDILKIRADSRSQRTIAKDYEVMPSTIFFIKTRKTWKHIL